MRHSQRERERERDRRQTVIKEKLDELFSKIPKKLVFNIDFAHGRNLNKYFKILNDDVGCDIYILNNHFNALTLQENKIFQLKKQVTADT